MTLSYLAEFMCINVGKPKRRIYLRLEICDLVSLQWYAKSLYSNSTLHGVIFSISLSLSPPNEGTKRIGRDL
ncbi:hypothetical protein GIB67_001468 [Kingdonia uniflora]|uniref:Uncharacterized protein n=1 Tax=Kingdonia uniflora TaxID=39325 RepID=A0A7J7PAE5_9MAGN|nr:hypothetical protein GIB67_001468 [Kingdonia uniflora]